MFKKLLLMVMLLQSLVYCADEYADQYKSAINRYQIALAQELEGDFENAYKWYLSTHNKVIKIPDIDSELRELRKSITRVCVKQTALALSKTLPCEAALWFEKAEINFRLNKIKNDLTDEEALDIQELFELIPDQIAGALCGYVGNKLARRSDLERLASYLERAARCGSEAFYLLGQLYMNNCNITDLEDSFDDALACYRRATEKGNREAMLKLAEICADNKQYTSSREWQKRAAF